MFRFSPGFLFLLLDLDGIWDKSQIGPYTSVMQIGLFLCKHMV